MIHFFVNKMKLMTLISCIASLACVGFAERLLGSRRGHREREGCIAKGSQLAPNPSDRDKMSVVSCQATYWHSICCYYGGGARCAARNRSVMTKT